MDIRQLWRRVRFAGDWPLLACVAFFAGCGGGGGSGSSSSMTTVALTGTAATGRALANATVNIDCARGSTTVAADVNGNYHATFGAAMPCLIAATSGGTVLRSTAFAGGTYNVTPETELLLVYMAAQLGTNESGLIAGFPANRQFQQALGNQAEVLTAQAAVAQIFQQTYGVTLSAPSFLTTSFTVGTQGEDSDLQVLHMRGVIDANGEPDAAAVSVTAAAGAAHPIAAPPASGTGGTGSGGTGSTGGIGGMGGMM